MSAENGILTEKEQEDYLKNLHNDEKRKLVTFKYPEGKVEFNWINSFVLKDPNSEKDVVVYWNVIDRMESTDKTLPEKEKMWLRLTYWRYKTAPIVHINSGKRKGEITNRRWINAGQTSFSNSISTFEEFFVQAIKEKDWVRPLFKNVMERCSKELT